MHHMLAIFIQSMYDGGEQAVISSLKAWLAHPHKPGSQPTVSETLANRPEHFSHGGGMTLSGNHSSCLLFTNAFNRVLILMRFWKADPHSWNRKGRWEAVSQSCCLFCERWLGGKQLYPTKETSVRISHASSKKCSAQANLPGSLKLCAETLACEDGLVWTCST